MKNEFIGFIFYLLPMISYAQKNKILSVGDKIPYTKLSNIVNYPDAFIDLKKIKGKAIIIDFWGTYCPPCIETLFKMDSLQKKYADEVQFITVSRFETKEKVLATIKRFSKGRTLDLPVVIKDAILHSYFPYQSVSHVVWISPSGEVKAITAGEYITESNLKDFLSNKKITWPLKKDGFGYDNEKPFLDFSQKDVTSPRFLYYSAITGGMPNVSPPQGWFEDSVKQTGTISMYNQTLFSLCKTATSLGAKKDEYYILDVKDSSKYKWNNSGYYTEWSVHNTYCYSITLPLTISEKEAWNMVKEDLRRWLLIMGVFIEKIDDKYIIREKD